MAGSTGGSAGGGAGGGMGGMFSSLMSLGGSSDKETMGSFQNVMGQLSKQSSNPINPLGSQSALATQFDQDFGVSGLPGLMVANNMFTTNAINQVIARQMEARAATEQRQESQEETKEQTEGGGNKATEAAAQSASNASGGSGDGGVMDLFNAFSSLLALFGGAAGGA